MTPNPKYKDDPNYLGKNAYGFDTFKERKKMQWNPPGMGQAQA